MEKIKVGISVGDINGIGLEVILKALAQNITDFCTPVIYCSAKIVAYHKNIVGIESFQFNSSPSAHNVRHGKINVVNCWQDDVSLSLGKLSETGGKYARISLEQATNDLQEGLIDALVTAPINKKAMQMAGFKYPGQTLDDNMALGVEEMQELADICGENRLHYELTRELLSLTNQQRSSGRRAKLFTQLEKTFTRHFFEDEEDALERAIKMKQNRFRGNAMENTMPESREAVSSVPKK